MPTCRSSAAAAPNIGSADVENVGNVDNVDGYDVDTNAAPREKTDIPKHRLDLWRPALSRARGHTGKRERPVQSCQPRASTKEESRRMSERQTKEKTAFAVYSSADESLRFYKRNEIPKPHEMIDGREADEVFPESSFRLAPWLSEAGYIETVEVVDEGIAPATTSLWFSGFEALERCDLSRLDVSVNIVFTIFANVFSPIAPTRFRRIRQRGCAAFGA